MRNSAGAGPCGGRSAIGVPTAMRKRKPFTKAVIRAVDDCATNSTSQPCRSFAAKTVRLQLHARWPQRRRHAPSRRRYPQTPSRLDRLVPRERARRHVVPFTSMCTHLGHRQSGGCREPLVVSLEREAEFVIRDAQITVRVARDRRWHDVLHFLRHHADVRRVPADVGEAVIPRPSSRRPSSTTSYFSRMSEQMVTCSPPRRRV